MPVYHFSETATKAQQQIGNLRVFGTNLRVFGTNLRVFGTNLLQLGKQYSGLRVFGTNLLQLGKQYSGLARRLETDLAQKIRSPMGAPRSSKFSVSDLFHLQ